ncbi:hypothetical protein V8P49_02055 [Acinetobacter baumannii]
MNLIKPSKKLKNVYFRFGEHQFILLTIFICVAVKQKWKTEEIRAVVKEACKSDYNHLVETLKSYT